MVSISAEEAKIKSEAIMANGPAIVNTMETQSYRMKMDADAAIRYACGIGRVHAEFDADPEFVTIEECIELRECLKSLGYECHFSLEQYEETSGYFFYVTWGVKSEEYLAQEKEYNKESLQRNIEQGERWTQRLYAKYPDHFGPDFRYQNKFGEWKYEKPPHDDA